MCDEVQRRFCSWSRWRDDSNNRTQAAKLCVLMVFMMADAGTQSDPRAKGCLQGAL